MCASLPCSLCSFLVVILIIRFQRSFLSHLVWVEKAYHPGQDGYTHPFQLAVNEMLEFRPAGYLACVNRRQRDRDNAIALNSQDGYPRKLYICYLEENNHAARLELLTVLKDVSLKLCQTFRLMSTSLTLPCCLPCLRFPSTSSWKTQNATALDTSMPLAKSLMSLLLMATLSPWTRTCLINSWLTSCSKCSKTLISRSTRPTLRLPMTSSPDRSTPSAPSWPSVTLPMEAITKPIVPLCLSGHISCATSHFRHWSTVIPHNDHSQHFFCATWITL